MITLITICLTFIAFLLSLHGGPRHTKISKIGAVLFLVSLIGWFYLLGRFCAMVVDLMLRYLP